MKLRELDPVEVGIWAFTILFACLCLAASVKVISWAVTQ
jgi:hypothetical protein